jgi:hypothetical protein
MTDDHRLSYLNLNTGKISRGHKDSRKLFSDLHDLTEYQYRENSRFGIGHDSMPFYDGIDSFYLSYHNNRLIIFKGTDSLQLELYGRKNWLIKDMKGSFDSSRALKKNLYLVENNRIGRLAHRNKSFWKGMLL